MAKTGKNHKAQAAMEYLVTYGWALIVIAGIIAILYSYVFKPEFYVAERCDLAPGLDCESFVVYKDGTDMRFILNMTNVMGFEIEPTEINMTFENFIKEGEVTYNWKKGVGCYPSGECTMVDPGSVKNRDTLTIEYAFGLAAGKEPEPAKLYRVRFAMRYNAVGTTASYRTAGIINIRVS